jgi:hypothetical protein
MVIAMQTMENHRLTLRVAAALAMGAALIVAAGVIPAVRVDPLATRDTAIRAFWLYVAIPQMVIAAMLLIISLAIRPGRRALNLASGALGLIAFALGLFILDAAIAFLRHGPGMRLASVALFVCVGLNILIGVFAVKVAISRSSEAARS